MSNSNEYPEIGFHRDYDSPFSKLKELSSYDLREDFIKDGKAFIDVFEKSFWGKKKVVEVVVEKIEVDPSLYGYDECADERFIGITIYSKGKRIYKSLYNLGVFSSTIEVLKNFHEEKGMEAMSTDVFSFESKYHLAESIKMAGLNQTFKLFETLFEVKQVLSS